MLKQNCAFLVVAAATLVVPTFLSAPANAQTQVYVVGQSDRDWNRDRTNPIEVRTRKSRDNWNRDGRVNSREVRTRENWDNWDRNGRHNTREIRNRQNRDNWNRDNQSYTRVIRLGNGDIRYPNGQIIPARSIARLRNQGYFRLPNGDILLPSEEIVPAARLVRVRDDYFRLPNGLVLQINL